ncbi:hypothetical protein CsSME_00027005 [Camellia sinensis var. sinensis]
MAPKSIATLTKLPFLFLLVIFASSQAYEYQFIETNMTLNFQEYYAGPNATVNTLTGIPGNDWAFDSFGTTYVVDDPITQSLDKNSSEIARGQGIYMTSSLDGANMQVLISIVFTSNEYNGSTLEIQGRSLQAANVREVSVVGGTEIFKFARGIAKFETLNVDTSTFYALVQCDLTVLHY